MINLTAVIDNDEAIRKFRQLENAAKATTSNIVNDTDRMDAAISKFASTLGSIGIGVSLVGLAKQVAQVRGEFQQLEVAFNTMLQSEEKAAALMEQLTRTAAITPFGLQDVAGGAKQLLAYGIQAEEVNETLVRLGDIAAGLSIPLGDLVYLYGTTMTQGRVFTQDLRQFMGRGIPLAEELAKQFNVAKDKVGKLVTEGKVGFDNLKQAIISMTSEGGKFGGLMEAQSKTITGQISNLQDAIDVMFNEIGQSSEGAISGAIGMASKLVENYKTIGSILAVLIADYGVYKASIMAASAYTSSLYTYEIAQLQAVVAAKGAELDADLAAAVSKGRMTASRAAEVQALRAEIAAKIQEATITANATATEAALAKTKFQRIQVQLALSKANVAQAKLEYQTALQSGNAEAIAAAKTKLATAAKERNILSRQSSVAAMAMEKAQLNAEAAAQARSTLMSKADAAAKKVQAATTSLLTATTIGLKNAFNALRVAMAKNPFGLLLVIATTIIGALMTMNDEMDDIAETAGEMEQSLIDEQKQVTMLAKKLTDANLKEDERKDILSQLKKLQPSIVEGMDDESKALDKLRENLKAYNEEMAKRQALAKVQDKANQATSDYNTAKTNEYTAQSEIIDAVDNLMSNLNQITGWEKYGGKGTLLDPNSFKDMTEKQLADFKTSLLEIYLDGSLTALEKAEKIAGRFGSVYKPKYNDTSPYFSANIEADGDALDEIEEAAINLFNAREATKDALQNMTDANKEAEKTAKNLGLQPVAGKKESDTDKTEEQPKDYDYWEKMRKDAEEARKAIPTNLVGSDEWNKQTAIINKANAELEKYSISQKKTKAIAKGRLDIEEQLVQLILNTENGRIALNENDRERELLEIEQERVKAMAQINKQKNDFAEKNKELGVKDTNESGLTTVQQKAIDDAIAVANKKAEHQRTNMLKEDAMAMRDYLKEYGSMMEKKLAITQEYDAKIAKASNEGERRTLRKEKQSQLNDLQMEELNKSIDWAVVFTEFGSMFGDVIRPTLESLEAYSKTEKFQQLDATSQKEIMEAITRMRTSLGESGNLDFKGLGEKIKAVEDAMARLSEATFEEEIAYENLAQAQAEYEASLKSGDGKKQAEAASNVLVAQNQADAATNNKNKAQADVEAANQNMVESARGLSEGMNEVKSSLQGIASGRLDAGINGMVDILGKIGPGKIGDAFTKMSDRLKSVPIVGWIISIIDILKDGLSNLIGGLLDAIFNAVSGILEDVLSGDLLMTIVNSILSGIGKIFDALTFGGFSSMMDSINGSNAKETAELIDKLTRSNELLKQSIDGLKDEISNSYGTKTIEATEKALEAQERYNENLRKILNAQMGYHNSHHSNAYYWNLQDESLREINDLLGTRLSNTWADFAQLTADQMAKIRNYLPEVWDEMINQGKYGERFADAWNEYADVAGEIEDLTNTLYENLTQISFESMRENFISALMDMDASAKNFTDNFSEMFQRAMLSFAIGDAFDESLKEWYDSFAKTMKETNGKLSQAQVDMFRSQYEEMAEDALKMRDEIANITGYDSTAEAQSATARGFQTMDQETGSELNGRFTDMQGKMAEQLNISRDAAMNIAYIRGLTEEQLHFSHDTRDILIQMAGNVADIRTNTVVLPEIREAVAKTNRILEERL